MTPNEPATAIIHNVAKEVMIDRSNLIRDEVQRHYATAVADLHRGETVLDLGSGGGIDVLLSAKRVGSSGFEYGLDTIPEMLNIDSFHLYGLDADLF